MRPWMHSVEPVPQHSSRPTLKVLTRAAAKKCKKHRCHAVAGKLRSRNVELCSEAHRDGVPL